MIKLSVVLLGVIFLAGCGQQPVSQTQPVVPTADVNQPAPNQPDMTKQCQNFPPPNFCPGGVNEIIVMGTDNAGCSIYGCKSNQEGQVYKNEKYGFEFQYPQGWKKSEKGEFFLTDLGINVLQLDFRKTIPNVTAEGFVDNFLTEHACKNTSDPSLGDHIIAKTIEGVYYVEFCSASSEIYHYVTKLADETILDFSYRDNFKGNSEESEKIKILNQIIATLKFAK